MADRSDRIWVLYLAILFNAAVYLDYIEMTVLMSYDRKLWIEDLKQAAYSSV